MITLSGTLERITFQNPENHYTIARIKTLEIRDQVTIVGHLAGVAEGETLKLKGNWVTHPKYGEQFKVESFEISLPASVGGIRKYLASGMIKGIKKATAGKIVDYFQEKALDIIENEPERLKEVTGIGRITAAHIAESWDRHHAVRRVMQFLTDHNVGTYHASVILRTYGTDAVDVLKQNPYIIARDIPEAGFDVADAIALKAGFERDAPERIKACVLDLLLKAENEGHVYLLRNEVMTRSAEQTSAGEPLIQEAIDALCSEDAIVSEKDNLYLKKLHLAETGICSRLQAMLSMPEPGYVMDEDEIMGEVLSRLAVKLSEEQVDVLRQILTHRVIVITGGPGTGKTTLIRSVCTIFYRLHRKAILCAPTGRAARRLSQVTDKKASTIHRLLLYDQDTASFGRNFMNPLDADVVIVDEASMVDTLLMFHLLQAVPVNSILILVGDIFQLPSVGPGNVLSDIIASGAVKTFSLTKIFRQAELSPIIMNAHAIRNGEMPDLVRDQNSEKPSEFYFIENASPQKVAATIWELCSNRISKAFPHISEIQVLTPMHRGVVGTISLNQQLQGALNQRPEGIENRGSVFRPGDKVMHLKNNYHKEVFNGDIGIVSEINPSDGSLTVDYDGRLVDYDSLELDELSLAYAVSVHKSQGSEYEAVVIALTTQHYPLLQRNLLYTALTRGRELVVVVGSRRALEIALGNNKTELRLSSLASRMKPQGKDDEKDLVTVSD